VQTPHPCDNSQHPRGMSPPGHRRRSLPSYSETVLPVSHLHEAGNYQSNAPDLFYSFVEHLRIDESKVGRADGIQEQAQAASRSMRKPSIFPTKCMPSARVAEAVSGSWSLFSVATFDLLLSRLLLLIKIRTNTNLLIMYLVPRCDEPGTTLECRQVYQPLEPDHQAVAKANQEHEMQDQPHDPS